MRLPLEFGKACLSGQIQIKGQNKILVIFDVDRNLRRGILLKKEVCVTCHLYFLDISCLSITIIGDHATRTIHADVCDGGARRRKGQTKGPIVFMANETGEDGIGVELF